MPFLSVLGHANIDVHLEVDGFPPAGESRPVRSRRTVYGGTACNIARQAAGLGVSTRLWSRVGRDFPVEWRAALEDDGVELALEEVAGALTPTCFIFTHGDDQRYCMDEGAMRAPFAVPLEVLDNAQWLHISTGSPEAYLPMAKQARAAGIQVAFDPGQEIHFAYDGRSFERLLDASDLFFCNDAELRRALGFLRYGSAEQLLDHVDSVVVTHAAVGASLYRAGHKPLHTPAIPAAAVDATGAGDALRAGWHAARAAGHDEVRALTWGQAAASLIVEHQGAQDHVLRPAALQGRLGAHGRTLK